jgi:hypothetical protein
MGIQWVAPSSGELFAETTLWIGLRVDGVWLTAPKMLF